MNGQAAATLSLRARNDSVISFGFGRASNLSMYHHDACDRECGLLLHQSPSVDRGCHVQQLAEILVVTALYGFKLSLLAVKTTVQKLSVA